MSEFKQFADAINKKFLELSTNGPLLRVNISKEQLSGLGFSSTIRNELFVKVDNRPYKILF